MKKSDIAMIVLIAGVSALVAFSIANSMPFFKPPVAGEKVKTVEEYKSAVSDPDQAIFNASSINPTVKTVIGTGAEAQ